MFDYLATLSKDATAQDASPLFQKLAQQLVESGQLHPLFEMRLLEKRYQLGLPLEQQGSLEGLPAAEREALEQASLQACREVGQLFLDRGQAREAWSYLRAAGEKELVKQWLGRQGLEPTTPEKDEEQAEALIALALYEGVDPERGFAWLLAQRGTCNAVTELDALAGNLAVEDQRACAAVLVRHMHAELLESLRGHLQRLELDVPTSDSIADILQSHPELLADGAYHVDTSHLGTTVRFARSLTEAKILGLAVDLAEYGSRLAKDLQYPDQPPFEDLYRTHLLLFRASLGEDSEAAIAYFRGQADEVSTEYYGSSAIEAYLILLSRVGQHALAMDEYARLVPVEGSLSAYAPTLLQLAQGCTGWERYLAICAEREDAVGYAMGLLTQQADG